MPIEQEIDIEKQQRQYMALFENFFTLTQELKNCKNIAQMSELMKTTLNEIDAFNDGKAEIIHDLILNSVYEANTSQLKLLVLECMQDMDKQNPAYSILFQLNHLLSNPEKAPKTKVEDFFKHLTNNDSANLKVLQTDNSRNMKKCLLGVVIIGSIVITGIIPGLFISAAIYISTGHSIFSLFKPKGEEFIDCLADLGVRQSME